MSSRARRLAPFAGYLMVACIVAGLSSVSNSPDSKDSGAKVIAFFTHHKTAVHVQDFLLAYAALAAIVYFTSLANFLRARGSQILATTTVAGAGLLAAGLCIGAGLNEALADRPAQLNATSAQALNVLSNNLFGVLMFAGLALATTSAGVAMLRTQALPKALGIVTTIVGVAAATGFMGWPAFLATGPLTLVVAPYLYSRMGRPTEIALPDATVAIPAQSRTESDTKVQTTA